MAFKCWEKVNSFIWVKKGENEALVMSQKGFEEKYTYDKSIKQSNGHYMIKSKIIPYTSKTNAEDKAKSYMKKNDRC